MRPRAIPRARRVEVPITPMIDCVFLLLIFFMVSSTLRRQETDIGLQLPGAVAQEEPVSLPDEQRIEILPDGSLILNGASYDIAELERVLVRFARSSRLAGTPPMVILQAADAARHQRVVDVLNLCSAAGIENVSFATEPSP